MELTNLYRKELRIHKKVSSNGTHFYASEPGAIGSPLPLQEQEPRGLDLALRVIAIIIAYSLQICFNNKSAQKKTIRYLSNPNPLLFIFFEQCELFYWVFL
jgi:hypothetical protein